MRCYCCNKNLSDKESTARHPDTEQFLDICFRCTEAIGISPMVREDLDDEEEDEADWNSPIGDMELDESE